MSLASILAPPLHRDADGTVRIGATRITLEIIVHRFDAGATPEEIVVRYPTLALADVYASVTFYLMNRVAVGEYLAARDAEGAAHRARAEAAEPMASIRERLLSRDRIAS